MSPVLHNGRRAVRPWLMLVLLTAPGLAQDWATDVERACTHRRYGLRLAASRKVAAAGDAAVPAIRAFVAERGQDALPVALVDAIATASEPGKAVEKLLFDWATNRDFYWRSQALRGLALRRDEKHRDLFRRAVADAAWLTRVEGARGLLLLGQAADEMLWIPLLEDDDPRARTRFAAALLAEGDIRAVPELVCALADRRTFLGNPWGKRRAKQALDALRLWSGTALELDLDASAADAAELRRIVEVVRQKAADALPDGVPAPIVDNPWVAIAGGLEVLSCRNGDLFLRWTPTGDVVADLTAERTLRIPEARWRELCAARATLPRQTNQGVVICDKMRLRWSDPEFHCVIAPEALPPTTLEWLKALASALEESGGEELARRLRDRLGQFAASGADKPKD